jgi:hypothetical protein
MRAICEMRENARCAETRNMRKRENTKITKVAVLQQVQ